VRRRAWERWQAAAGTWKGWSVCPALIAPEGDEVQRRSARRPAAEHIAAALAAELEEGGVLVAIDLEPSLGVHVAARLNQRRLANAVLVLPRWPYRQAILPVEELIDALVSQAARLGGAENLPNVAFVFDAERSRRVPNRATTDPRADNRSRLATADLPDLRTLRQRGIRKVIKLGRQ
jgi:hypothetical protein